MIDLLPDAPDPANDIPAVFSQKAAALVLAQKAMVPQINYAIANLSSIAAGGAFSAPLVGWGDAATVKDGFGRLTIPGSQNSVTNLFLNTSDASARNLRAVLEDLYYVGWTSANRGYVTIYVTNDPTRRVSYRVTGYTYDAVNDRLVLGVAYVSQSGAPLGPGESFVMQCSRTGDKGDTGPAFTWPLMILRDQQANGVAAQTLSSGTWATRRLNTANLNTIAGASLGTAGANIFTLPAGTYLLDATAGAVATQSGTFRHQIRLYNLTNPGLVDAGTSEYQSINTTSSHFICTRSIMHTFFAVSGPSNFTLDHYSTLTATGGYPTSTNTAEIYTEIRIIKIA
jgi:hypothetical protein